MAKKPEIAANSTEDRQAVATVEAVQAVYAEITHLADAIKEDWRTMTQRLDARHALAHASERLCNLMALAIHQMEMTTQGALREHLTGQLDDMRSKLIGLGARLMVEKLEKIDQRAENVLKDQDYPIGLSGKLDVAFANLMSNLTVLGGAAQLGEKVPGLVAKTETDLKSLAAIERKLGVMVEMQPKKSRS